MVSHERIYQYIRKDKKQGGSLYKSCCHELKYRRRYIQSKCSRISNKVSIEQRPNIINNRERFAIGKEILLLEKIAKVLS